MDNKYKTTVIKNIEKENAIVKTFTLDISFDAKPGQYIMVWLPRINEKPFGIANSKPLTISVAKVGPFSEKIHQLKKGDKLSFRGPYGNSFTLKGKKILIVGGGYGVVPLYFFASSIPKEKRKNITAIIGAREKNLLAYVDKFKKLGCKVEIATDDGSVGFKGYTPDLAEKILNKEKFDSVYTCGPEIMMKKVAKICKDKRIFCQVSVEKFFKCGGIGLCGACSMDGNLVCKEGPVFEGKVLLKE